MTRDELNAEFDRLGVKGTDDLCLLTSDNTNPIIFGNIVGVELFEHPTDPEAPKVYGIRGDFDVLLEEDVINALNNESEDEFLFKKSPLHEDSDGAIEFGGLRLDHEAAAEIFGPERKDS